VLLFSLLSALFITMAVTPLLMQNAARLQLIDAPNSERKVHTRAVPPVGGIAMALGTLVPLALLASLASGTAGPVPAMIAGLVLMLILGVADDRFDLDYRIRLLGQVLAAAIVVFQGGIVIRETTLPWLSELSFAAGGCLTVIALVGITNAINLSDGLDGLAGGTVLLVSGTLALLGFGQGDGVVLLTAAGLIGSIIGFLRFNTHPARVFMGDGGAYFLGFGSCMLAILITQPPHPEDAQRLSAAMPLLLFGLPVFDTLMVVVQRLRQRRSPFAAGRDHTHHKLLALGLRHHEAVMAVYVFQFAFVAAAYLLRSAPDPIIVGCFLLLAMTLVVGYRLAQRYRWLVPGGSGATLLPEPGAAGRHALQGVLRRLALAGVSTYLLVGAFLAPALPADLEILVIAMFAVQLGFLVWRRDRPLLLVERMGFYVAATCLVYVTQVVSALPTGLALADGVFFVGLAISIVLSLRGGAAEGFQTNPLDILVLLIAVTIPNLPELGMSTYGPAIAKLVTLFYGIELVVAVRPDLRLPVRVACCLTLALLASKDLLS
jgi:UDP-GlcNAc:undecaprenyl-phosphate GlcNAc-1-phosphate transferase